MRSRVYEERGLTWLRAETAASASQTRVAGGDRGILTISKRVLEPSTDGTKAFVVRIPGDVAAAIEAHEDRAYAVEALIGEVWVPAALETIAQAAPTEPAAAETVVVDGIAPEPVAAAAPKPPAATAKRGRGYKPAAPPPPEKPPPTTLPPPPPEAAAPGPPCPPPATSGSP